VSNVSFGLPQREMITASFFTLALGRGLSAAIMNPYSAEMMKAYFSYRALAGLDENFAEYIAYAERQPTATPALAVKAENVSEKATASDLQQAIIKGMKDRAAALTSELLESEQGLVLVEREIIPALDRVGEGFERKTVYLPQLLMSAEAARAAFDRIKESLAGQAGATRCAFLLATVKGDIHDIGKNIVKLLLENYGFAVTDLGRDVEPEVIADAAVRLHAPLVGLSALMTTTVPAMEETIRLLRRRAPWCRVVVGGAVLTKAYADAIGADHYARDAMEAVRYAEEIERSLNA